MHKSLAVLVRSVLVAGILSITLSPPAAHAAASAAAVDPQAIDRFVVSQMDKHRIPGIALAVIEGDRVVYANGYGDAGSGRPMTADTPMNLAFITKSFTAVAVLQLVDKGKIKLDAPVQTYLPWIGVTDDEASSSITVRHLLNHTSGLSDLGYNKVLVPEASLAGGVRDLPSARLTAPVGTAHQYFNPNYSTLALIVETISGQSYGAYVQEHIFDPLRMERSYTNQQDAARAGIAQGHIKLFGFPVRSDPPFRQYMVGAGYLTSTAGDLAHFMMAMSNDGTYGDSRILTPGQHRHHAVSARRRRQHHVRNGVGRAPLPRRSRRWSFGR